MVAANGTRLDCQGSVQIFVNTAYDSPSRVSALVSQDIGYDLILSWHDLISLHVITEGFASKGEVKDIRSSFTSTGTSLRLNLIQSAGTADESNMSHRQSSTPMKKKVTSTDSHTLEKCSDCLPKQGHPTSDSNKKIVRQICVKSTKTKSRKKTEYKKQKDTPSVSSTSSASTNVTLKHCTPSGLAGGDANFSEALNDIFSVFPDVFDETGKLKPLKGKPMEIHLRDDVPVVPRKCLIARQVPIHYRDEAVKEIQKAVDAGILAKVEEPTEWISPSFFVPKPGGKGLRLVTDYTQLNKFVRRPVHPFPSALDVIKAIDPSARVFARFDAVKGYFQIPLSVEASLLTTMLLPQGRYRYLRAPMGLSCSSDEWNARSDEAIKGLPGVIKLVDDILVQGTSIQQLRERTLELLKKCREAQMTLSASKRQVGTEVNFAGFIIGDQGTRMDDRKLQAIRDFPAPTDVSSLRSFLGLANQLGPFVPDLAHLSEPLRGLLKKNVAFQWLPDHQLAFLRIKKILTSPTVVHPFNTAMDTDLVTDASCLKGLGFALIQRDPADPSKPRLIQCGSRSLLPAESRYAPIELEALAIVWAVQQCKHQLYGMPKPFRIVTDHKPLLGVFKKSWEDVNNHRLQRFLERLCDYDFYIDWTPGKTHYIADALSRAPAFQPDINDMCMLQTIEPDSNCYDTSHTDSVYSITDITANAAITLADIIAAAQSDESYQLIYSALQQGKAPEQLPPSHPARLLQQKWDNLATTSNGLVRVDDRILVPLNIRSKLLQALHLGHAGISRTKELARSRYFWPHMSQDIEKFVNNCSACQRLRSAQAIDHFIHTTATEPMQAFSSDLFDFGGKSFLLAVDRFSGYPLVAKLSKTATSDVTIHLDGWFAMFGYPLSIRTDGGPQFRTEFDEWCSQRGINHELSSPYHPQSNGHAEAAVKNIKHLIEKCNGYNDSFAIALSQYRLCPRALQPESPARLFFGRHPRSVFLPRLADATDEHPVEQEGRSKYRILQEGEKVILRSPHTKRWDQEGIILKSRDDRGRSYFIQVGHKTYVRNRRHLKPLALEGSSETDQTSSSQKSAPSSSDGMQTDSRSPRRSPRLQGAPSKKPI